MFSRMLSKFLVDEQKNVLSEGVSCICSDKDFLLVHIFECFRNVKKIRILVIQWEMLSIFICSLFFDNL